MRNLKDLQQITKMKVMPMDASDIVQTYRENHERKRNMYISVSHY